MLARTQLRIASKFKVYPNVYNFSLFEQIHTFDGVPRIRSEVNFIAHKTHRFLFVIRKTHRFVFVYAYTIKLKMHRIVLTQSFHDNVCNKLISIFLLLFIFIHYIDESPADLLLWKVSLAFNTTKTPKCVCEWLRDFHWYASKHYRLYITHPIKVMWHYK